MKDTLYRFGFVIHLLGLLWSAGCASTHNVLNDLHSKLNPTTVDSIHYPTSTDEVLSLVRHAISNDKSISISGGQHSMGGQQYGTGTVHLNMSGMNDVLKFDGEKGIVKAGLSVVAAGITEHTFCALLLVLTMPLLPAPTISAFDLPRTSFSSLYTPDKP